MMSDIKQTIDVYHVINTQPTWGLNQVPKILIDGVPTTLPPKLDVKNGDVVIVIRKAGKE